jgi:hypothetical protein
VRDVLCGLEFGVQPGVVDAEPLDDGDRELEVLGELAVGSPEPRV